MTVWEKVHKVPWTFYEELLVKQLGRCGICQITLDEYRAKYKFHKEFSMDHCHASGAKRGLLCHNCNRAIGMLQDSVEHLQAAIRYLNDKR